MKFSSKYAWVNEASGSPEYGKALALGYGADAWSTPLFAVGEALANPLLDMPH